MAFHKVLMFSPRQLFLNTSPESKRLHLFPIKSLELRTSIPTQLPLESPAICVKILEHIVKMWRGFIRVKSNPEHLDFILLPERLN